MPDIRMPDGQVVRFPDDMPREEIVAEIEKAEKRVNKELSIQSESGSIKEDEEPVGLLQGFKNNALALKKGYHGLYEQHLYHTLANIPGMMLSKEEKIDARRDTDDEENTGDTSFKRTVKKTYDFFKDSEELSQQKAEKIDSKIPNNFWTKFYAGVGATPGMVSMYAGPQALLKSTPLAIASVDALSKADEGVVASVTAGAKGALLGKYMDLANTLAPISRTISLGALGYGSAEGDLEQRLANGLTFATLGAIGPIGGQRTFIEKGTTKIVEEVQRRKFIKDYEKKVDRTTKNLSATIDSYNLLADKKSSLQKERSQLEKRFERQKDPQKKQETRLRIDRIETEIKSASASQGKLKKQLDTLDDFLTHHSTFVNRVNQELIDYRKPTEAKLDAVNLITEKKIVTNKKTKEKIEVDVPKVIQKYKDLPKDFVTTVRKGLLPREFLNEYPVFKRYVDEFNLYRIATEDMVLKVLDNPKITSTKGLTALRKGKMEPSDGGVLVRFNKLSEKEKGDLVTKTFEIERKYDVWSSKKKDERGTEFDKEGTVSTQYLEQLGLNTNQIVAYRDIMNGFETVRKYYNSMAKQFGGYKVAALTKRPNFFPHIFTGEYRVYISKNGSLVEALPTTTEVGAKLLVSRIKDKYQGYDINYRKVEKNKQSDDAIASFSNVIQHLDRRKKDKLSQEIKKEYDDLFAKSGFNIHKLPRKKFSEVSGFLGTKAGKKGIDDFNLAIKLYTEGAIKIANGFRLRRNIQQFSQTRIRPESHQTLESLYPNSTRSGKDYIDNALGRQVTPIGEFLQKAEPGIFKNLYTKSAALANHFYLLQLNFRFAMAQGIQPYQMIPPKLAHLSQLAGKDSVSALADAYTTVALIQKELVVPNSFSTKLIQTATKNRTINDSFLREFAGEGYYKQGKFADVKDIATRLKGIASGRAMASNIEQFSRLNATLMFGHHLKRLGVSEKDAINQAWRMADKYMVRYDLAERPFIYQQLGTVGRAAGLFKTFMHNYHAQLLEAIKNSKRGDTAQLAGLVASSILAGGLTGALFVKSADGLVSLYNRIFDQNVPTLSMMFIKGGLPDAMVFGVPSTVTNLDLTATLAAPSVNPMEIISFPGFEFGKNVVFASATLTDYFINDKLVKLVGGPEAEPIVGIPPSTSEIRDAWKKLTPNSLHGAIELFYQKNSTNPFYTSKQNARLQRDLSDWFARFMSSYSLKEAMLLKITYQSSISDRSASATRDKLADLIAENMFKFDEGLFIPEWMFEKAMEVGYTPEQLITSVKRRVKNMSTDAVQKVLKGGISVREQEKLKMLLDTLERQSGGK